MTATRATTPRTSEAFTGHHPRYGTPIGRGQPNGHPLGPLPAASVEVAQVRRGDRGGDQQIQDQVVVEDVAGAVRHVLRGQPANTHRAELLAQALDLVAGLAL